MRTPLMLLLCGLCAACAERQYCGVPEDALPSRLATLVAQTPAWPGAELTHVKLVSRDSAEAAISAHLVLWMDSIHTDINGRQWNKMESRGDRTFIFRCTDRAWHWAEDSGAIVGGVLDSSRIVADTGARR